jgi:CRISPR-associated protein Cas2
VKHLDFLICYDISDEKRLRKLAKFLEKNGTRIQNSVFLYPKATKQHLKNLLAQILELIDQEEDDVRIYNIDIKNSLRFKSALDLNTPFAIIGDIDV